MRWLVTRGPNRKLDRNYQDWLDRLSIRSSFIAAAQGLPPTAQPFDALLLTGGGDVDPTLYGEKRAGATKEVRRRRDDHEVELVRLFLRTRKPIFGICRGMQILNVALRGGLIQDLPSAEAETHTKVEGTDSLHPVHPVEGTRFSASLPMIEEVNSAHHQSVDPERLGNNLRVAAVSPSGVIEVVESIEANPVLFAVQWHPERMPFEAPGSSDLLRYMQELAAGPKG